MVESTVLEYFYFFIIFILHISNLKFPNIMLVIICIAGCSNLLKIFQKQQIICNVFVASSLSLRQWFQIYFLSFVIFAFNLLQILCLKYIYFTSLLVYITLFEQGSFNTVNSCPTNLRIQTSTLEGENPESDIINDRLSTVCLKEKAFLLHSQNV